MYSSAEKPLPPESKLFCSWSGGKDCTLALDRYTRLNPDHEVILLCMLRDGSATYAHNLDVKTLRAQADSLGREIRFGSSGFDDYEKNWKTQLETLKSEGVTAGIFGDIDLQVHFDWIRRVTLSLDLGMEMPLWKEPRSNLVREFVSKGYKARIVSVRKDAMDKRYLGKLIDDSLIAEMESESIDPSGEGGEFHTFVVDGPMFSKSIDQIFSGSFEDEKHCYVLWDR